MADFLEGNYVFCIPEVKHEFPENHMPFSIFEKVVNLDILLELLVNEAKIYAQ